jgi:hypothetical protein
MRKRADLPIDASELKQIRDYLQHNKIHCIKHNSCLDTGAQDFQTFQAYIQYDLKDDSFTIMNRRVIEKLEYVPLTDQREVSRLMHEKNADRLKKNEEPDDALLNGSIVVSEIDEKLDGVKFKETKSFASFSVSDIDGLMFGGISSRFWLMRKSISSMDSKDLKKLPFFSWNCLTIFTHSREIELVIKDEKDMERLLKYLIFKL